MVIEPSTDGLPESVLAIASKEAMSHKDDIDKATLRSLVKIKKLVDYEAFVHLLIEMAVRELIHNMRHRENVRMRKDRGEYGGKAKVVPGEATAKIVRAVYDYMIAGITLGSVLGEDLQGIADAEAAKADGHSFNANLCRKLHPLVGKGKMVRECVKEAKLQKMFDELG